MNYSQAQDIARLLAPFDHECAKWLRTMCESTGRTPTFIIMRYGDPRKWTELPTSRDNRMKRRERPKTKYAAENLLSQIMAENGQAAVALRRRVRVAISKLKYTTKIGASIYVLMRDGDPRQWPEVTKGLRSKKARRALSLARPCDLENIDGRRIKAPSIALFCEKAGIPDSRYHISPVLDGNRFHHKGWHRPETLAREVELRDKYGNLLKATVKELIAKGILTSVGASSLLEGKKKSVGRGWHSNSIMLADTPIDSIVAPRAVRITKVKLTDGRKVFTGTSVTDAARKAGVTDIAALYSTVYGFRDEAQGMRVKEIEAEKRSMLSHGR